MDLVKVCGHFGLNILELLLLHLTMLVPVILGRGHHRPQRQVRRKGTCLSIKAGADNKEFERRTDLALSHYFWKLLHERLQSATEAKRTDVLLTTQRFLFGEF